MRQLLFISSFVLFFSCASDSSNTEQGNIAQDSSTVKTPLTDTNDDVESDEVSY